MNSFSSTSLRVENGRLLILDQTLLPQKEVWLEVPDAPSMVAVIRALKVRGAPLIGVAAALQLGLMAERGAGAAELESALFSLREARPTAVNLMNAMDRCLRVLRGEGPAAVAGEAEAICLEDVQLSERLANHGASLIEDGDNVLTHCNTGGLATVGVGTALGAVIKAHRDGKRVHVFVDETRPLLQGGRLTTWELAKNGIPYTLICDSMAGALMSHGRIDRILVGADRIARNGDFANKVGTYSLAALSKFHGIPFLVFAPQTTVDLNCAHGAQIPVEERCEREVRGAHGAFGEVEWATANSSVWNPAFDITPAALVTAWVLDRGIFTREDF